MILSFPASQLWPKNTTIGRAPAVKIHLSDGINALVDERASARVKQ